MRFPQNQSSLWLVFKEMCQECKEARVLLLLQSVFNVGNTSSCFLTPNSLHFRVLKEEIKSVCSVPASAVLPEQTRLQAHAMRTKPARVRSSSPNSKTTYSTSSGSWMGLLGQPSICSCSRLMRSTSSCGRQRSSKLVQSRWTHQPQLQAATVCGCCALSFLQFHRFVGCVMKARGVRSGFTYTIWFAASYDKSFGRFRVEGHDARESTL